MTRLVLRANAIAYVAVATFLALSPWDRLYETLGIAPIKAAIPAQVAAVFAVALAYLMWIAPRHGALTHAVAAAAALANTLVAVVSLVWVFAAPSDLRPNDAVFLGAAATAAFAAAAAEAWIASRSVAMLVPGD